MMVGDNLSKGGMSPTFKISRGDSRILATSRATLPWPRITAVSQLRSGFSWNTQGEEQKKTHEAEGGREGGRESAKMTKCKCKRGRLEINTNRERESEKIEIGSRKMSSRRRERTIPLCF